MKFHYILFALSLVAQVKIGHGFLQVPTRNVVSTSSSVLFGTNRKARRMQKAEKEQRGRTEAFYKAIEEAKKKEENENLMSEGVDVQANGGSSPPPAALAGSGDDEADARRQAIMEDAQERMNRRPELSTMIVDEETGFERIAQGQSVLDVVTRKAVKLSDLGPEYRLAQMFPGVPPDIREKYRFDWSTVEVPEMVDKLREACYVKLEDGSRGLPPHPSVANKALDFILANRDLLGSRMKRLLGRLTMQAASEGKESESKELNKLWKHFLLLENHISAPFRQIVQDAEGRVGPNFGNLDLMKFCNGEIYERVGNYIVLKGMVAHWEKKVVDADYIEKTEQTKDNFVSLLTRGDPKRYLPDPPILYTLKECTQVCAMAQQMCKLFIENEQLYGDFPPEIVFLEDALKIKGGTALRKYMIDEFCPARKITPEGLREGMRRFYQQLDNMQIDPYGDITNKVEDLFHAMAVGTDDERDPYVPYLTSVGPGDPGFFQTYTFNHPKQSIVRFLDNQYASASNMELFAPPTELPDAALDLGTIFNFGETPEKRLRSEPKPEIMETYKVPEERASGRPHELGWFEMLNRREGDRVLLGQVPPGKIIPDE